MMDLDEVKARLTFRINEQTTLLEDCEVDADKIESKEGRVVGLEEALELLNQIPKVEYENLEEELIAGKKALLTELLLNLEDAISNEKSMTALGLHSIAQNYGKLRIEIFKQAFEIYPTNNEFDSLAEKFQTIEAEFLVDEDY